MTMALFVTRAQAHKQAVLVQTQLQDRMQALAQAQAVEAQAQAAVQAHRNHHDMLTAEVGAALPVVIVES